MIEKKTIDILISDELRNILKEIESESLVAYLLLKKTHLAEDIVEDCINYISVSNSDKSRISYLSKDRSIDLEEDKYWNSSKRYNSKPGSFIKKIWKNIPPKEVEKFSNLFKAESVKPYFDLKVVSGKEIKNFYYYKSYASDRGSLGISCMKHDHCQDYFGIYYGNPDIVSLLIMINGDNKLIGRALLWNFDSYKLMDRIYTICDEEYLSYFKKWAVKNGYLHKSEQNWFNTNSFEQFGKGKIELELELELSNNHYGSYPYMDTFKFIGSNGHFYNYQPKDVEFRTLCSCDGNTQSPDYLRFDGIDKVFRYPGDCVDVKYLNIFTHYNNTFYSESNDKHLLKTDAKYVEEMNDYIFNEDHDELNDKTSIEKRMKYFKSNNKLSKKISLEAVVDGSRHTPPNLDVDESENGVSDDSSNENIILLGEEVAPTQPIRLRNIY